MFDVIYPYPCEVIPRKVFEAYYIYTQILLDDLSSYIVTNTCYDCVANFGKFPQ